MPFTLIASVSATSLSATVTTSPIDTTGADLLLIAVASYSVEPALSDSQGNASWVGRTLESNGPIQARIFYHLAPATNAAHTFTAASGSYSSIGVLAVSGAHASPYHAESAGSSATSTTVQAGSLTPPSAGCLLVTGVATTGAGAISIDSGYSEATEEYNPGFGIGGGIGWLIQGALAAVNPTWTFAGSGDATATHAVFKPAVVPSGAAGPVLFHSHYHNMGWR